MSEPASSTAGNGIIGLLPVALAAALFAWFTTFIPAVAGGETVRLVWDWVPSLSIALSFVI
ncbi:MAG: hypothetical protein AAFZ02_06020, partial [Pseudomonadota bacterium]